MMNMMMVVTTKKGEKEEEGKEEWEAVGITGIRRFVLAVKRQSRELEDTCSVENQSKVS